MDIKKNSQKYDVYKFIEEKVIDQLSNKEINLGCTTIEISNALGIHRANVSKLLNELHEDGIVIKHKGRPVLYSIEIKQNEKNIDAIPSILTFDTLIGAEKSLKKCIQQVKAAVLYPPRGLNTLLLGETGVGKTMFAELMRDFAISNKILHGEAPFVSFNCADYANNPQLLMAHLFGAKKGAYTGAIKDRTGVVEKANDGILFLDEVHRLPPEGQEMLFYLMDKGEYTSLGDVDTLKKSSVLIICATTENINNKLLSTFTRRIPISVTIPPLKERTFEERFQLICHFLRNESIRINREILVSPNTFRCLILYKCDSNVGQLKSDIQRGCANAFLKSVDIDDGSIYLNSTDLSSNVKQGLIYYRNNKSSIDKIINDKFKLAFSKDSIKQVPRNPDSKNHDSFYENIQGRIFELEDRKIEAEDITEIMSLEVENYFKQYVGTLGKNINKQELAKIVPLDIIELVEDFLNYAGDKLNRIFPNNTFYGLAQHIKFSIDRLNSGKKIVNHNLKEIMEDYKEEYAIALTLTSELEKRLNLKIPIDEVGFITMFLTLSSEKNTEDISKPVVVVAMHGDSTATSMSKVAQTLIGGYNVYPYDMSLDKNTDTAFKELKELIVECNRGSGVLLLVDMGSLKVFGPLIQEETSIKIKVVEMASTLMVIECSRMALIESDIERIWLSVNESHSKFFNDTLQSSYDSLIDKKKKIIITVCTTGEGSALALKEIIESRVDYNKDEIQIIPLNISNKVQFYASVNNISKDKKILAIVGTFNPDIYGVPFIPISELFSDDGVRKIETLINGKYKESIDMVIENYNATIDSSINVDQYKHIIYSIMKFFKDNLEKSITEELVIGLTLHIICAIKRIQEGKSEAPCECKTDIMKNHFNLYTRSKEYINDLLLPLNVEFGEDELCNILKVIL